MMDWKRTRGRVLAKGKDPRQVSVLGAASIEGIATSGVRRGACPSATTPSPVALAEALTRSTSRVVSSRMSQPATPAAASVKARWAAMLPTPDSEASLDEVPLQDAGLAANRPECSLAYMHSKGPSDGEPAQTSVPCGARPSAPQACQRQTEMEETIR